MRLRLLLFALLPLVFGCPDPEQKPQVNLFDPLGYGTFETNFQPQILSERRVNFGDVERGSITSRTLEIHNVGKETLKISEISISEEFQLIIPREEADYDIGVGESITVQIIYEALHEEPLDGQLIIHSNDPNDPTWTVDIYANQRFPCLLVRPEAVDFGIVEPGDGSVIEVEVSNCSPNADTTFSLLSIEGEAFFQANARLFRNVVLLPGESVIIMVGFAPQVSGNHLGRMVFESDDFFEPGREVPLKGYGKDAPCPTAIIQGTNPAGSIVPANPSGILDALPLDSITLSGSNSFDPEGRAITYEWSLVRRPTDSAARIEPNLNAPEVRIWLDLAGEYHVDLSVISDRQVRSCQTARMRIVATADQDIHIQLVWDTPNDPNQHDSSGSDVDLHLLHPNGNWDQTPWDCFWRNLNPDWGVPRQNLPDGRRIGYDDDPSLDIDDVNGWGPENINLDNPENLRYSVGVHYFSDHGYGASFATVRVYIGGVLFHEFSRQRIVDGDFWHVGDIVWPGGIIHPVGTISRGFPE